VRQGCEHTADTGHRGIHRQRDRQQRHYYQLHSHAEDRDDSEPRESAW